jgi:hypothetical protein
LCDFIIRLIRPFQLLIVRDFDFHHAQ